ncbi:outer membrane lipoprotein carrier protein LolA [Ornithinibacillus sp. BX22]|uniref:Outer membrane lipoprotein carrier protein LolA n=2 Tax=Ornithinibacillus TaxID=484508 RepID=A0A923RK65_9BACI|nr:MULTISPECIES: outer membrane lipoprotein carrier protein LolA [Ornithinibacillus]MBC5636982.1 outer membrane lipoprotein carrier protein LolA [Ornithinibacillus hominis]MBS3681548.1 outer membrane lipoprotein carrier protein LolA [Ornithinibacillus massiliensis]
MIKKSRLWMIVVFGIVLVLAACGEQSQEDVVKKLGSNVADLAGYKANVEMKMNTGQEEQLFKIDVWHKKEDFYRVALSNNQQDKGSQIILKNKDGVFVLTPELKKSFKFQSDWPDNSSQPYLYQSLVEDIANDEEAEFTSNENHYIFKTKTNYQSNNNLPYQEIYFDKENYTPALVKVLDTDGNAVVEVKFNSFELNPSFNDKDFEIEENMASATPEDVPTSGDGVIDELEVMVPIQTVGAELAEQVEVDLENGKRIISTFTGEKNFTLVQEKRNVVETLQSPVEVEGDIVNLGFGAIGALSENAVEWDYNGSNFYLASDQLTREELVEVAQSVQGHNVK